MTEEEWQHLCENFETTKLFSAVNTVDSLRDDDGSLFAWRLTLSMLCYACIARRKTDVSNKTTRRN